MCLGAANGAQDGNATAGWTTLGIGLGVWAVWDWWIEPSLAKDREYPPAREIKRSAPSHGSIRGLETFDVWIAPRAAGSAGSLTIGGLL